MLNKKLALIVMLGLALVAFNGCSDDDETIVTPAGPEVTLTVIEASGGYTGLEIRGDISSSATAMTQEGSVWTGDVSGFSAGATNWEVWGNDGAKAMVLIGGPYDVTLGSDGTVGGGSVAETILPGGTVGGYVFTVVDEGSQYSKIMFKGTPTEWATVDMVQFGNVWTHTVETLPVGDHEWGAIEDDGSEWGIWLPVGANPTLVVVDGGAVTEGGIMTVNVAPPVNTISLTLNVDMTGETEVSPLGVHVAGNFQGWDPAATALTDDDEDGIYTVTLEVTDNPLNFKFLNGNGWGEGIQEVVPEECGVDDNNGAFNREVNNPGTADITYSCAFSSCPSN